MKQKKFGIGGPDVSVIGQGTWYLDRGDRKEIHLTDAGLVIGEESTRKHRLIERWLQKELRLSSTEAHEAAEGFEAGFTPLLLDRLYDSLGYQVVEQYRADDL